MKGPVLNYSLFHERTCTVLSAGDRTEAVNGILDPKLNNRLFDANDYLFGLEFASPESIESIGESIITAGNCFTRSTDSASEKYLELIIGPKFYGNATLLFPKDLEPNGYLRSNSRMHLSRLYNEIYAETLYPTIGFVGFAKFESLQVNTIQKPPIHNVSMLKDHNYYFPAKSRVLKNVYGVFTGAVHKNNISQELDERFSHSVNEFFSEEDIESNLFPISLGKKNISTKARFLELNTPFPKASSVQKEAAQSVWAVYMEKSVVVKFGVYLFYIDEVKNILNP